MDFYNFGTFSSTQVCTSIHIYARNKYMEWWMTMQGLSWRLFFIDMGQKKVIFGLLLNFYSVHRNMCHKRDFILNCWSIDVYQKILLIFVNLHIKPSKCIFLSCMHCWLKFMPLFHVNQVIDLTEAV